MITPIEKHLLKVNTDYLKELLGLDHFYADILTEEWFDGDQRGYADDDGITLKYMDMKSMMITLAHECKHIQQIQEGKLVLGMVPEWNGVQWDPNDYYNQPWEKEAFHFEDIMIPKLKRLSKTLWSFV